MIPYQYAIRRRSMSAMAIPGEPAVQANAYGVAWAYNNPSTALVRLGASASFAAPVPAVGTGAGFSPFDGLMPWSGMRICNVLNDTVTAYFGDAAYDRVGANGDVMVEIPKFWYKCTDDAVNGVREYWIADGAAPGFSVHPAFLHNGAEQEHIYIARYTTSTEGISRSAKANLVNKTRAYYRAAAAARGAGWSQWDIAALNALQMLYLVEFADWNSQAKIARGYVDGNTSARINGYTDAMSYHTGRPAGTDGKTPMQYRYVENLWGNIYTWIDGCYVINGATACYCLDQSRFSDAQSAYYTPLGYSVAAASGTVSALGYDAGASWLQLATATNGTDTTYIPDTFYATRYSPATMAVSGTWAIGSKVGLFFLSAFNNETATAAYLGSRLMKV